ncbi:type IV pilus twitching motility protein PilT [Calditerrivibrio nitroreducens]|uniref:type IV pilus twitching motility protein PilT n=1 Tax=Calditerrivibrio nitroreducens TaxID=477976 RepID=UPI0005A1B8A9
MEDSVIDDILKLAFTKKASDIHIKAGKNPIFRINGQLIPSIDFPRLTPEDTLKIAGMVMSNHVKAKFKEQYEADFSYSVSGFARFRVNAYIQRGTVALVFRVIPHEIPSLDSLGLPKVISKIAEEQRGLILVTGTTGSGKSTTLAGMIDYINTNDDVNIITIEDPIEFLHKDKKSIISQREIGTDTLSFAEALKRSLRQDPDVILVGEMRDLETIETALHAAETGHLVMSTLHTLDAPETINRIISIFPPYHQKQVRIQLASVLRAIISMRLVQKKDGTGRVPAVEVMINTATIKECIIDKDKTQMINDYIEQGKSVYGSQSFDQSLYDLYKADLVTLEEALKYVKRPDDFKLKIKGISSSSDTWGVDDR